MDDEDFRALIEALARQLREVGAGDITDERHYFHPDREGGEARLLGPQKHLVEMLSAFERYLAARDRATYRTSLARMNDVLYGDGPRGRSLKRCETLTANPSSSALGRRRSSASLGKKPGD